MINLAAAEFMCRNWNATWGLSGKYQAILNISRTGRVALM